MKTILHLCAIAAALGLCVTSVSQENPAQKDTGGRKQPGQFAKKSAITIDPTTGEIQAKAAQGSGDKVVAAKEETVRRSTAQEVDPLIALPPPDWASDPATKQKYFESLQGYYEYRRVGYQHRQGDFTWQHYSTIVIFISVLILVFSGIYFAYVQFHADLKLRELPATTSEKSELELSAKGIKVSSPVLGVIILAVSLAFFYLYLVYVYPISDAF